MKPILGRVDILSLFVCNRRATGVECHSRTTGAAWGKLRWAGTDRNSMRDTLLHPTIVGNDANNASDIEVQSISTGFENHSKATWVNCHRRETWLE